MSSLSTQYATSRRMAGVFDPLYQIGRWGDAFRGDTNLITVASTNSLMDLASDDKAKNQSHASLGPSRTDQEANPVSAKLRRRLAQNREAARKSRMRKKAYVQQLEASRLKLAQLELEVARAKQKDVYIRGALDSGHIGFSGNGSVSPGIATFEMEYGHWVEEQQGQLRELRIALHTDITDVELRMLVENGLNHYINLFRMKEDAAKADILYLISGMWRTPAERFFLWIGGFRPSELLTVLMPQLEPLTDQQLLSVGNLRQLSQQAEEALSQGMDKLQESLAQSIIADPIDEGSYQSQMATAFENLEALESFVSEADHLRKQTLRQMSLILTIRQSARGLLVLGEYFHRLRALSSLWVARPRDPS